jgi:uncharacterized protein (DUF2384 family)
MTASWTPTIERLEPAANPNAISDVLPLLRRLVDAYQQSVIAEMLGVDDSTVSRWLKQERSIGQSAMRGRILELHDVVSRAHQVFNPTLAARWLTGHEPFLGNARPIDVLALRGAAPVIDALDAISAGGFV